MAEWFEDESFWAELYGFMFSDQRFREARAQADRIVELVRFEGTAILDLCCGPGRISIPMAQKGYAVTGVDLSAFLLEKARQRARGAGLHIEYIQEDMRRFKRPESFDLALSMFTSFGYFEDKAEDAAVLKNIYDSLKSGGSCLIDVVGKELLAGIYRPSHAHELEDGSILLERHQIFDDWTRIRNEWILIRGERAKTFRFHHTVYSGQELRDLMERVGFRVQLYGDLSGGPYGTEAERLIAVGWKPE